jgi:hypothetical protein
MMRANRCLLVLGFSLLGLIPGCGEKQPEVKLDPALANKPFPPVNAAGDPGNRGKKAKLPLSKSPTDRR